MREYIDMNSRIIHFWPIFSQIRRHIVLRFYYRHIQLNLVAHIIDPSIIPILEIENAP